MSLDWTQQGEPVSENVENNEILNIALFTFSDIGHLHV